MCWQARSDLLDTESLQLCKQGLSLFIGQRNQWESQLILHQPYVGQGGLDRKGKQDAVPGGHVSGDVDGQHSLQSGVPADWEVSDRPFPRDGNLGLVTRDLTGNLIGGCHGVVLGGNRPDPLTRVEGDESLGTVRQ